MWGGVGQKEDRPPPFPLSKQKLAPLFFQQGLSDAGVAEGKGRLAGCLGRDEGKEGREGRVKGKVLLPSFRFLWFYLLTDIFFFLKGGDVRGAHVRLET